MTLYQRVLQVSDLNHSFLKEPAVDEFNTGLGQPYNNVPVLLLNFVCIRTDNTFYSSLIYNLTKPSLPAPNI